MPALDEIQQPRNGRQRSSIIVPAPCCAWSDATVSIALVANKVAVLIVLMVVISYIRTVKPIVAAVPDRSILSNP